MSQPGGRDVEFSRVRDAIEASRSILVSGLMGVGKTALLRSVAHTLGTTGINVTTIAANAASARIPFGALTGFIDPASGLAPAAQIATATNRLGRVADERGLVLFLDDAQHLDVSTIAVVHQLVTLHDAVLMASIRSSDPAPRELDELWRHAEVTRLDLQPLDDAATQQLVRTSLGETADAAAVAAIASRSAGNPLFVGELVQARIEGIATGLTPQLIDLVQRRIEALTPQQQEQLTIVAVGQPLDVALEIVDLTTLTELESLGLVTSDQHEDTIVARPAHPLYSEVIRTGLSPLRRRGLSQRLGHALLGQPHQRRGDALRVVNWLLDAGDRPPPELAETAALEAAGWLDNELADRLATIAVEDDRTAGTLFALGEIRRLAGQSDSAAQLWEEAFAIATADNDIRKIALALGQLYELFLSSPDKGIAALRSAHERITDPSLRLGIDSALAMDAVIRDRRETIAEIEELLANPDFDDEAAYTALANILWSKAVVLDLHDIDKHVAQAKAVESRLPVDRDGELDLVHGVFVNIAMGKNRLNESIELAEEWRAESTSRGIACGITLFATSVIRHQQGRLDLARIDVDESLAHFSAFDAFNAGPMVCWHSAILSSASGNAGDAAPMIAEGVRRSNGVAPWQSIWQPRAEAWLARAQGDIASAIQLASESGKAAMEAFDIGWGLYAFHDAVAWGAAEEVVDGLERVRTFIRDAPFFDILLDHGRAAAQQDLGGLAHCARRFEDVGIGWYAAAAWANRAVVGRDAVESCRDATRALSLIPPNGLHPDTASLALSERQLAVARASAAGQSSKEVAAELFVSPRTVDNHLREVYRRLGMSGRGELAEVVGPLQPSNHA